MINLILASSIVIGTFLVLFQIIPWIRGKKKWKAELLKLAEKRWPSPPPSPPPIGFTTHRIYGVPVVDIIRRVCPSDFEVVEVLYIDRFQEDFWEINARMYNTATQQTTDEIWVVNTDMIQELRQQREGNQPPIIQEDTPLDRIRNHLAAQVAQELDNQLMAIARESQTIQPPTWKIIDAYNDSASDFPAEEKKEEKKLPVRVVRFRKKEL